MRSPIWTALFLAACTADGQGVEAGEQVPDFLLEDVNQTSATAGAEVSPRDAIGMRSAWYFGHAT